MQFGCFSFSLLGCSDGLRPKNGCDSLGYVFNKFLPCLIELDLPNELMRYFHYFYAFVSTVCSLFQATRAEKENELIRCCFHYRFSLSCRTCTLGERAVVHQSARSLLGNAD